ncbi:hypothetical protein [Asticcacaulis biprosthecium]|nr:hypothetical protein [Asticcacaulis biprosthecium]
MAQAHDTKMVKRLNTTLPDPLAAYVGEITGKGALYESPGEFIRDLVRRHMERSQNRERADVQALLSQSLRENSYEEWTSKDMDDARRAATE